MPRRLFSSHKSVGLSLAVILLGLIGHYLFGRDAAKTVLDSLVIGAAFTISISWSRVAWEAIRNGLHKGSDNIKIGVWGVWAVLFLYFILVVIHSSLGRPEWLRESPVWVILSSMFFLMGAYAILTPINTAVQLPRPVVTRWLLTVAAGAFLAGILIALAFTHNIDLS